MPGHYYWPPELTGDPVLIAPRLLGCVVGRAGVAIELTEVEAYRGEHDPASHAFRGLTPRTAPMFGPPGHLYVYLSYGVHRAANIVTTPDGVAGGILLRAGRVVDGVELARERRPGIADLALARGPGNLGKCLGLALSDSGRALVVVTSSGLDADDDQVWFRPAVEDQLDYLSGPRVGVSVGHESPFRFWTPGDPSVSTYRISPRAPRADSAG